MKKAALILLFALVTVMLLGLESCQKEVTADSPKSTKTTIANSIGVQPTPALTWWGTIPGPAYSDGLQGDWIIANQYVRGFSINGIGFSLGTLITSGKWDLNYRCYDLWQFDPTSSSWIKKSPYPGDPINLEFGASFVIGDNAYVISVDNHVYRYNQPSDRWTEVRPIPTSFTRINASCFAINGYGYFGMGENYGPGTFLNDWFKYDPVANQWTSLQTFPGAKREGAACFAVDGKGYVVGGRWTGGYGVGVWQYNPANDHWLQMQDFPGGGNYIYMPATATGTISGVDVGFVAASQAWQYNPAQDFWYQLKPFSGVGNAPGGFVIGRSFFICSLNATIFNWSK